MGKSKRRVIWIGFLESKSQKTRRKHYEKFKFGKIVGGIGDYVLISSVDADKSDVLEGCDVAKIVDLYEADGSTDDPFRAVVQWYTHSKQMPSSNRWFISGELKSVPTFDENCEVIQEHRRYENDISLETIYKCCKVITVQPHVSPDSVLQGCFDGVPVFVCRFKLTAVKGYSKLCLSPVISSNEAYDESNNCDAASFTNLEEKSPSKSPQKLNMQCKSSEKSPKKQLQVEIKKEFQWKRKLNSGDISSILNTELSDDTDNVTVKKRVAHCVRNLNSPSSCVINTEVPKNDVSGKDSKSPQKTMQTSSKKRKRIDSPDTLKTEHHTRNLFGAKSVLDQQQECPSSNNSVSNVRISQRMKLKKTYDCEEWVSLPITSVKKKIESSCNISKCGEQNSPSSPTYKKRNYTKDNTKMTSAVKNSRSSSDMPHPLLCREKEFYEIFSFIHSKIIDGVSGCMYISGVPGTGKTATVQQVVRRLQSEVKRHILPEFQFIEVNGMRLTEPKQAYVQLLLGLTGKKVSAVQAQKELDKRFKSAAPRRLTTLLLVDELDLLKTRRQDVIYSLLDWPSHKTSHLVVLTIANTMDLPERSLMSRVTSRMGLTRLTFEPYSYKQLQEIITERLRDFDGFDSDAIQLISRKVAAVSGDARRALDMCRRAAELAESKNTKMNISHVDQVAQEMISSPKVQAIKSCSLMEQKLLQAVASEVERTGVEETVFKKVYCQLTTLCAMDGLESPNISQTFSLLSHLTAYRLLIVDQSQCSVFQRILLNISADDIHYAIKTC